MDYVVLSKKPHAVVVPYPTQGHIIPMFKIAKLLHSGSFHITFVLTDSNHSRLLRSQGAAALAGLPDFQFEVIPDGMTPSDPNTAVDHYALISSVSNNLFSPFLELLEKLNRSSSGVPPVTRIVADGMSSFCIDAGNKLGIPVSAFWTASACGLMGYLHYDELFRRGLTPLKDESYLSNGYLNMPVDWIPGMKNIRLKDLPSFLRTIDPDDALFNFLGSSTRRNADADAIIINTFDELERPVLEALSTHLQLPPIYTIGPINLLLHCLPENPLLNTIVTNFWKEDAGYLEWLEAHRTPRSVVFVNFGTLMVMSNEQVVELAWGLANSGYDFLWVLRSDLVKGEIIVLPPEFLEETKGRGMIVSWCAQEKVLSHQAVGAFLTHAGWNSMLESFSAGVPILCFPFFAEQQTNCRYACMEWEVGMEIDNDMKREEVEGLIKEMMTGEKGGEMRKKMKGWKERASMATEKGGSSFANFERLVKEVLL